MTSRAQFQAAISGAPTPVVAAGVVTALHLANCKELIDSLQELVDAGQIITRHDVDQLRQEYATA